MSKIPVPRNRSTSNSQRRSSRSVGTQTNESNYNTLHSNAVAVNSSPAFASTPTTNRNARRALHVSDTTEESQHSIEVPKEIASNFTQIGHTNANNMGRSSISNLTEMATNSKSQLHSNAASGANSKSSRSKKLMPQKKHPQFYLTDNSTEEEEADLAAEEAVAVEPQQIQPSQTAARLDETFVSRKRARGNSSRKGNLSMNAHVKESQTKKLMSKSLSKSHKTVFQQADPVPGVPTTSANANQPNPKRKSSISITKRSQVQQNEMPEANQTVRGPLVLIPEPIAEDMEEIYEHLNENSIFTTDEHSIQHRSSRRREESQLRVPQKRKASKKAVERRSIKMALVREFEAEIAELSQFNHETSTRRRSERLRLKRLRKCIAAKYALIQELQRQAQLIDFDMNSLNGTPKRSKKTTISNIINSKRNKAPRMVEI